MPDDLAAPAADLAGRFEIYEEPDDDDDEADPVRIGSVRLDGDGRLEVIEADPAREAFLRDALDQVNRKQMLGIRDPGPASPDERFAVGSVAVPRGTPDFVAALRIYLLTYYGLRLAG